jgi:polyisoprenoid-binding protein YceI
MQPATQPVNSMADKTASRFVIDGGRSTFTVQAFSTGLLSAFGHNPRIAIRDIQGEALFTVGEATIEDPHVHITIRASSLEVIDDISDRDRREIHRQMHDEVLEVGRFPEIVYDCSRVSVSGSGNWLSATLNGELALHGETHPLSVSARVVITGDVLKASGEFSVSQRAYGIAPVTVAGGAIKLKDNIKCMFNIVARKQG